MASVIIKGFTSDEHAKTFISWFEGQGEQDQYTWFEENNLESQLTDCAKTYNHPDHNLKQDEDGNWVLILEEK